MKEDSNMWKTETSSNWAMEKHCMAIYMWEYYEALKKINFQLAFAQPSPPRDHHGGLASTAVRTVWGSEESGKKEKGLPPNSKEESPPKNVVEPKERGKLLVTPIVTELSKN